MTKSAMPRHVARDVARSITDGLEPYCERLEVAGSLRRECEHVGDLELVAIPRYAPAGLFGDQQENALWAYLNGSKDYRFLKGNNPDGRYFQLVMQDGVQIDLFTAQPSNWGWCLLVRTGCADFSRAVLTEWKRQRSLSRDQKGSIDGFLVDRYRTIYETPEERDVFALLNLSFVEPKDRNSGQLRPRGQVR